jgi:hypothetical protein
MMRFTDDERLSLGPLLNDMSARARRPLALVQLIDKWAVFVSGVEGGYALTGYDYTNELSGRDLLEEVIRYARSPLREKVELALAPLDARLQAATRELMEPIRLGPPPDASWWWRRVPHDLSSELASDLLSSR